VNRSQGERQGVFPPLSIVTTENARNQIAEIVAHLQDYRFEERALPSNADGLIALSESLGQSLPLPGSRPQASHSHSAALTDDGLDTISIPSTYPPSDIVCLNSEMHRFLRSLTLKNVFMKRSSSRLAG
jgi:hypothetical protein